MTGFVSEDGLEEEEVDVDLVLLLLRVEDVVACSFLAEEPRVDSELRTEDEDDEFVLVRVVDDEEREEVAPR